MSGSGLWPNLAAIRDTTKSTQERFHSDGPIPKYCFKSINWEYRRWPRAHRVRGARLDLIAWLSA